MNNLAHDWQDDYAEVEVFVHVSHRHKITLKIPKGSTAEDEALRIMKSEPIENWCDKDSLEHWADNPHNLSEDSQFEIGSALSIDEAYGCDDSAEAHEEIKKYTYNLQGVA